MTNRFRQLHDAVPKIVGTIDGPRRDAVTLSGGRAVQGSADAVELADRVGSGYMRGSRRLGGLAAKGLVTRQSHQDDHRVDAAMIAPAGRLTRAGQDRWIDV